MSFKELITSVDSGLWLEGIEDVFARMDAAYDAVASACGFHCRGCEDNCCFTRFYHHTLVELLYVKKGLSGLDPIVAADVADRARDVIAKTEDADGRGETPRFLCPLNVDGLCMIYTYRPMICRLHGPAHELRMPGRNPVQNEGCGLFSAVTENKPYVPFDRTPLYKELAALEGELRRVTGFRDKIRYTLAEMVLL
jgi:Fe-S-cluster containining protein